jgi:hypothetical protein
MQRATILIGCGTFGREVLRRLLVTAALRDLLRWETDGDELLGSRRRLAGWELFCLADREPAVDRRRDFSGLFDDTHLEVLRDVEGQLQDVGIGGELGAELVAGVEAAARRLLAPPRGATGAGDWLPGLDLIVVAHLADREAMGRLDALMTQVFVALGRLGTLQRGPAGGGAVAAVALLDVDNYWDSSPNAQALRQTLAERVSGWETERQRGGTTFGRVYMSGEVARQSVRPPELRIDEASLLLELLLFEGRRREGLQRLFQPLPVHEPSLGTFGIRLFERNHALVAQLAAARFAIPWLRYLAGDAPADGERPSPAPAARLAPFHPQRLDQLLGWEEVPGMVAAELASVEGELIAIDSEREDWAAVAAARCEHRTAALHAKLAEAAGRAGERLSAELARFPAALDSAVTAALGDAHRPLPLGALLAELAPLRAATLAMPAAPVEPGAELGGLGPAPAALASHYRQARDERLSGGQWRGLLATLSLLAAMSGTYFLRDALADLQAVGPPSQPALARLAPTLEVLAKAPVASLALLLLAAAFFFGPLRAAVQRRLGRDERSFADPRQGRLVDALRAPLADGGAVNRSFTAAAEQLRRDLAVNAATTVGRELDRVVRRLEELRREALWLGEQLAQFLALYGLGIEGRDGDDQPLRRDRTGIRQRAERGDEIAALLRAFPPEPALYRSLQAERWVFADWRQPARSLLLRPLEFLQSLGQRFRSGRDAIGAETDHQQLLAFLAARGGPPLAFDWREREGVPPAERLALLPRRWAALDGVRSRLLDVQVDSGRVIESDEGARAYLVSVRLGLRPELLRESA